MLQQLCYLENRSCSRCEAPEAAAKGVLKIFIEIFGKLNGFFTGKELNSVTYD